MIDPVSGSILSEGNATYGISVDFVVELEEDAEVSVHKESMGRFGENVIERKTFFGFCESLRCQKFLDRKMRELYYLTASLIDYGDQTGACGQHQFFCIQWLRTFLRRCGRCRIELD